MSLSVVEAFGSQEYTRGKTKTADLRFVVFGATESTTAIEVHAAVAADEIVPSSYGGMASRTIKVAPLTNEVWSATVTYQPSELRPEAESTYVGISFTTTGAVENVQTALAQSYSSLMREDDGTTIVEPLNPGLSINIDENMAVNGIDITVPKFEFNETHYISDADIGANVNSYMNTLHNATGKTNDAEFRGFGVGQVLFTGAYGSKRPAEGDWEITFTFIAAPDALLTLPLWKRDGTAVLDDQDVQQTIEFGKPGHDYIWFHRQRKVQDGLETVLDRSVNIARVYARTAFDFVPTIGGIP